VDSNLSPIGGDLCWPVHADHYKRLLLGNYIGMHAAVMYRKNILSEVGGFDPRLPACEDYDLYLRIALKYPVGCHAEVAALYRQHPTNMSRKLQTMLSEALRVLESQYPYVRDDADLKAAYDRGIRNWWEYFGDLMFAEFSQGLPRTLIDPAQLLRVARLGCHYPYLRKWLRKSRLHPSRVIHSMRKSVFKPRRKRIEPVQFGSLRSLSPIGSAGTRDSVVTRYHEMFFEAHHPERPADVVHIGPDGHSLSFLEKLSDESCSCICLIYPPETFDVAPAINHLHRVLKRSGVLLAVLPGIVMNREPALEQDYWRFTIRGAQRLFSQCFGEELEVRSRGNVVTSVAALHRIPAESLTKQDFSVDDPQYPLVITVRARKS